MQIPRRVFKVRLMGVNDWLKRRQRGLRLGFERLPTELVTFCRVDCVVDGCESVLSMINFRSRYWGSQDAETPIYFDSMSRVD